MEYQLPKDIAKDHSISLKTVYNYLSKYPDKIRVRQDYGKRFVHAEDFSNTIQESFNVQHSSTLNTASSPTLKKVGSSIEPQLPKQEAASNITDPVLEKENHELRINNEQLVKRNDVLERQIVKYSELHKEEKQEKMAILAKYEKLWEELNSSITDHARQIIQSQKRRWQN